MAKAVGWWTYHRSEPRLIGHCEVRKDHLWDGEAWHSSAEVTIGSDGRPKDGRTYCMVRETYIWEGPTWKPVEVSYGHHHALVSNTSPYPRTWRLQAIGAFPSLLGWMKVRTDGWRLPLFPLWCCYALACRASMWSQRVLIMGMLRFGMLSPFRLYRMAGQRKVNAWTIIRECGVWPNPRRAQAEEAMRLLAEPD